MRHSLKTFGVLILRVVSSFSLVVLTAWAYAGSYGDLAKRLHDASTPQEKVDILRSDSHSDGDFEEYMGRVDPASPKSIQDAVDYVELRASLESHGKVPDQTDEIKKIKSSAFYKEDNRTEANWLASAMKRFNEAMSRTKPPKMTGPSLPNLSPLSLILIDFVWFILGAGIIAFIIYALRFVSLAKLKKRRARAVLEDNEPERTLDEWLALAESLESEGRYREAVRALYLACLLKFDERNIARFIRSQTNWEHLARIQSSPRTPAGLDFRRPTQAFDQIWYGHRVRGPEDVLDFKAWYRTVCDSLREAAA